MEIQGGLVAAFHRVKNQHGIWLHLPSQAGEVSEC